MVDENDAVPPEQQFDPNAPAAPTDPVPAVGPDYGIDAPEPVDLEPPVIPEPEPVVKPVPSTEDFEPSPPPPPPSGPAPGGYAPPPPPPGPQQQYTPPPAPSGGVGEKNKVLAGVLAILLGELGIHKFYLGYTKEGLILLAVTVLSFGLLSWVTWIIGLVEGIIYLTKTDGEFHQTYVAGRKPWF